MMPSARAVHLALFLFFGWLLAGAALISVLGSGLEGVYYPLTAGLRNAAFLHDWRTTARWVPAIMLALYGGLWVTLIRRAGPNDGPRVAAMITALAMPTWWVVPLLGADLYGVSLNWWWLGSLAYANVVFLLVGLGLLSGSRGGRGAPR